MIRKLSIVALVLLGLGVAYAEEKVQKDSGTARASFKFDKFEGDLANELNSIQRTVDANGVGTVEINSGVLCVSYDPEKTTASSILDHLKDTRTYEAAKLTSVVAIFKAPFATVTATAIVKGAKSGSKRHGELVVRVDGPSGTTMAGKPKGKFKPGVIVKAPHEVELDRGAPRIGHESYAQGISLKKGSDDAVIAVTVNLIVKGSGPKDKEELHSVELAVPVAAE